MGFTLQRFTPGFINTLGMRDMTEENVLSTGSVSVVDPEQARVGSLPPENQNGKLTSSPSADAQGDTFVASIAPGAPQSPAVPITGPKEAREAGEGGAAMITNAEFIAAVFPALPEGAFAAVCSKAGDPCVGGWPATRADKVVDQLSGESNNFVGCSSFYPGDDGSFKARKGHFAACHFLMLDDVGTKVAFDRLAGFELSWLIETSPGNHQGGIILAEPLTDGAVAIRLLNALIEARLCDAGASGPLSRWARLPVGVNGKPKHAGEAGVPFRCRLVQWHPDKRYTPEQIVDALQLGLAPAGKPKAVRAELQPMIVDDADDVFTPKAAENPVVVALKDRGLYKTPLGSGKHDVTCPWVHEHTDGLDTGAAYFEPDDAYPIGGYCCQHSHRDKYRIRQLLEFLGVPSTDAKHKSIIYIVPGDLHRVVSAAEKELAARGRHYQCGGLIVSISTDPSTGDPSTVPTSVSALTKELSVTAIWVRLDRKGDWVPCDPPSRHVGILYDAQNFHHLPPLLGVARQPYFRESDGVIITQPGYDNESKRFGVFDPKLFPMGQTTVEAAKVALALIRDLLREFRFVSPTDEAAALSAIFTAVVRASLVVAPAFHVRASVFGSGKSYLCEVISAFAGPGLSEKVSYPTTSEEATKVILSLLLKNPACVEFDDMDSDWLPHGVLKRMLTSEKVSDRILGVSKTATVSTRTLFLGSGNNCGPIRDMLRRVVTINLDPRVETPAILTYTGNPVASVRANRGRYVMAVMTIIEAWRQAGKPRTDCDNIVSYDGAWSDYCRHPLMWLGLPDPATSLLEQVKNDPDADALKGLMTAWRNVFGATPTTVRKAVNIAQNPGQSDLLDSIREFPVEERGEINRSKLGWLLKKNANRIVSGFEFQKAEADGRTAWCVVAVNSPPSPPSPPSSRPAAKSVIFTSNDDEVEL